MIKTFSSYKITTVIIILLVIMSFFKANVHPVEPEELLCKSYKSWLATAIYFFMQPSNIRKGGAELPKGLGRVIAFQGGDPKAGEATDGVGHVSSPDSRVTVIRRIVFRGVQRVNAWSVPRGSVGMSPLENSVVWAEESEVQPVRRRHISCRNPLQ